MTQLWFTDYTDAIEALGYEPGVTEIDALPADPLIEACEGHELVKFTFTFGDALLNMEHRSARAEVRRIEKAHRKPLSFSSLEALREAFGRTPFVARIDTLPDGSLYDACVEAADADGIVRIGFTRRPLIINLVHPRAEARLEALEEGARRG